MLKEEITKQILEAGYQIKPLFPTPLPPMAEEAVDLSIVIPVYNAEQTLSRCLDSILKQQTHYRYEVICINDGSTDGSAQLLQQYQQQFSHLRVYSQANGGISVARNAGIVQATGCYIGFIDNDDYVTEDYVERMLTAAFTHQASVIQVGYDRVSETGKVLWSYRSGDFVVERADYMHYYAQLRGTIWGGCFHRSIFQNIRFPEGYWYEDMINKLVLLRLSNRIVSINDRLYFWVARSGSAMSTYWKSYKIQSLDQIWLPEQLADYSEQVLGLIPDEMLQKTYVHEYNYMLYLRTHKLPLRYRKLVFSIASENLRERGFYSKEPFCPISYHYFMTWNFICKMEFIRQEVNKRFRQVF